MLGALNEDPKVAVYLTNQRNLDCENCNKYAFNLDNKLDLKKQIIK